MPLSGIASIAEGNAPVPFPIVELTRINRLSEFHISSILTPPVLAALAMTTGRQLVGGRVHCFPPKLWHL